MRRFLVLLPLLLFSCGFGHRPSVVERTLRSVVPVAYYDAGRDEEHICTGFVVTGGVLTASHCAPLGAEIVVAGKPGTILRMNEAFALLSIGPTSRPPLEIRTKPVQIGERVLTFGFGYGHMEVLGRGVSTRQDGDIGIDGPIAPGMSGGPVVDMDGRVVGLNQASSNVVGVACGGAELAAFLKLQ